MISKNEIYNIPDDEDLILAESSSNKLHVYIPYQDKTLCGLKINRNINHYLKINRNINHYYIADKKYFSLEKIMTYHCLKCANCN